MSDDADSRSKDWTTLICIYLILIFIYWLNYPLLGQNVFSDGLVAIIILLGILATSFYCCLGTIREDMSKAEELQESLDLYEIIPEYYDQYYTDADDDDVLQRKPIPGVAESLTEVKPIHEVAERDVATDQLKVLRGGEFVGNRMRLKVKLLNESEYLIADVTVYILTYPHDSLNYSGKDHHIFFSKIEPGGFRSPTFDFLPTQDCVKGEIVAGVSYVDMKGTPHTLTAKPFVIRSVCDLLLPQHVTSQDFELKLKELECGEIIIKINEWTPEEMFDKALTIVDESNFFEVSSKIEETDGTIFAEIIGFAQGKYTGKEVGVEIRISGPTKKKGASCTIKVLGEDQAMILPAIDDLKERLSAWLCPLCSSPLTLDNVAALREGEVIECPFCSVSIGR